ncbi:uncharacterized protein LOC116413214 [Galleria mellonella]|uniref:Uncharacterized protein LOC116413214 n=1 Tax=Galleria mellonella TaxID=7137 RepID=A0ABM3MH87_GALME|nr:uncharacterized protein LOC116413214 [Galleria mellonella]XP_052750549.1 uncharacterized protein LOC116413214 [Galleria mellonella]XP_052750550.1 uncharacterized protein LOC116413214 [Galleria mellonella]
MERAKTPEDKGQVRETLDEISTRADRFPSEASLPLVDARDCEPSSTSSHQSRASSPCNETVNQQNRECLHVSRSPENELKKKTMTIDDFKLLGWTALLPPPPTNSGGLSSPNLEATSQSSIRKRMQLEHFETIPLIPEVTDFSDTNRSQNISTSCPIESISPNKRRRLEETLKYNRTLDVALKDLSQNQLIDIIKSIIDKHPDIEDEVRKKLPVQDLMSLQKGLLYLKMNILKILSKPGIRFEDGSLAFSHARIHLEAFKNYVVKQGEALLDSQNWKSVIEYVILAWRYVRVLSICNHRIQIPYSKKCFEALSDFCMTALKKGNLEKDLLIDTQDKLQRMVADSGDIQLCIEQIQEQLSDS